MSDSALNLMSTGEVARRLGRSISGVKKLVSDGRIPPGTVIAGSGRRVWRIEELPSIEQALREGSCRKGQREIRAA